MENMNDDDFIKNCNLVAKFIRVRYHKYAHLGYIWTS